MPDSLKPKVSLVSVILILVLPFLSCKATPTPVSAIPNGTKVILICKSYCIGDTPVHLRGSTGRSAVIDSVPDNSEAVVLESTVAGGLLYYRVQVDSLEGWVEVASYDVRPVQ